MSKNQNVLTNKMKLDFLIEFDNWSPSGGGFPWQEDDSDVMDFINNHFCFEADTELSPEEIESLVEWYNEMSVDSVKALLPVYEAFSSEYEAELGYPMNEDFSKQLRALSSKPKVA